MVLLVEGMLLICGSRSNMCVRMQGQINYQNRHLAPAHSPGVSSSGWLDVWPHIFVIVLLSRSLFTCCLNIQFEEWASRSSGKSRGFRESAAFSVDTIKSVSPAVLYLMLV